MSGNKESNDGSLLWRRGEREAAGMGMDERGDWLNLKVKVKYGDLFWSLWR